MKKKEIRSRRAASGFASTSSIHFDFVSISAAATGRSVFGCFFFGLIISFHFLLFVKKKVNETNL